MKTNLKTLNPTGEFMKKMILALVLALPLVSQAADFSITVKAGGKKTYIYRKSDNAKIGEKVFNGVRLASGDLLTRTGLLQMLYYADSNCSGAVYVYGPGVSGQDASDGVAGALTYAALNGPNSTALYRIGAFVPNSSILHGEFGYVYVRGYDEQGQYTGCYETSMATAMVAPLTPATLPAGMVDISSAPDVWAAGSTYYLKDE